LGANGHNSAGHTNGKSKFAMRVAGFVDSPSFKESGAFVAAEGVSMITSLGVVAVLDQVASKPLKSASKFLSKTIIEPHIETLESIIGRLCKLDECKVDESKSKSERAERLAHITIVFSAAWAISMAFKMVTRHLLTKDIPEHNPHSAKYRPHPDDKKFLGMSRHEWKLWGADEAVHYGSLLLLNTGAAKLTDEMIRTNTRILTKCGLSEQKAHELSSMAWIWEFPNVLGAAAGIGVISKYNNHNWGQSVSK
jgi:hypothetical protein